MATIAAKVVQIGNSVGIILPKTTVEKLNLEKGDQVMISETDDGITVTAYDEKVGQQIMVAREVMREYRNALRELAK